MSKRRRDDDFQAPAKKSKRIAANSQPSFDQVRACQEIHDALRATKGEDGRLICEHFIRAPSRRSAPEYYKVISNAIDFMRIQQKLKTEEYENVDQLAADVKLLVDNAKSFFKKGSQEAKDAGELWEAFGHVKQQVLDPSSTSIENKPVANDPSIKSRDPSPALSSRSLRSASPSRSLKSRDSPARFNVTGHDPVDKSVLEELLASVVELTDDTGRTLCPPFRLLPPQQDFPEYYEAIKEPMDLKTITERVKSGQYRTLNELEKAVLLVCRNAKTFNEPGSMIYKDANALRKFVTEKKSKLLETAIRPIEKERAQHNRELLEELIRIPPPDEDMPELSEDSDEDESTEQSTDPKWILYWTVRNFRDPGAELPLAEVFCELPDRSWYPDYYDEVKEPISLFIVNKKLKRNEYRKFMDVVVDINLICANAKAYNIEGSEIHTNACRLQVLSNRKAKELDPALNMTKLPTDLPPGMSLFINPNGTEAGPRSTSTPGTSEKKSYKKRMTVDGQREKGRPGRKTLEELMSRYKGKLTDVLNKVWNYKDSRGRPVAAMFVQKPDPIDYPDYYEVIPEPIDLEQIKINIENDKEMSTRTMSKHWSEPEYNRSDSRG